MQTVDVQSLIDAGVHFGCRVSRWNPKMAPYIHGRRNLIHVIDLRETVRGLVRAQNFLYNLVADGQQILWVGTKRQVRGAIKEAGERTGMPVVTERWIGGTLTNFSVIRSRLRRLEELETMEEDGSIRQFSKKVVSSLRRERRKVTRNLAGIREMNGIPGAMIVVDPGREANAVREARKMGVTVIGILDTDCDPQGIDVPIPGNDDSLKSVRLLVEALTSAVEEGAAAGRERMAAVGAAQRSEATELLPGDEPRPTRGRSVPRPAVHGRTEEDREAAAEPPQESPAPTGRASDEKREEERGAEREEEEPAPVAEPQKRGLRADAATREGGSPR